MTLTVRWTRRALGRLDDIGDHIAKDSPAAARRVFSVIARSIARLAERPAVGRVGRIEGTRELVVDGTPYIVAYRVHERDLEVLTILHGAQKWPDAL